MNITYSKKSTPSANITLETANALIRAARAASQKIGFEVAVAVTDAAAI